MLILEKSDQDAKVVDERAVVRDLRYQELVDDMIQDERNRLTEDWEYERENYADKFAEKAQESDRYEEFTQEVKESDLDEVEMMEKFLEFDENEYQIARDKVIEDVVNERAGDWNNALNLSEYLNTEFGENTEVYYKSSYG